jgi:thiol-disulfide isomerase/thioredoxin
MVKTNSNMAPLGTQAPDFNLLEPLSQQMLKFSSFAQHRKVLVVMFICNHCPFVKHINEGLVQIAKDYEHKPVGFLAINSNDVDNYPEDSPANMANQAKALGYPFPYLFDETQEVAELFHAACTPDFFVFNEQQMLVYRGQFDDSRPGSSIPVTGKDLRHAIDCILDRMPIQDPQKPSMGCNIKWKEKH